MSFQNPSSPDDLPDLDALADSELDVQLSRLRDKLTSVGKESTELSKELCALEKQSLSSNLCAGSVGEAVELYEKQATTKILQGFRSTRCYYSHSYATIYAKTMSICLWIWITTLSYTHLK